MKMSLSNHPGREKQQHSFIKLKGDFVNKHRNHLVQLIRMTEWASRTYVLNANIISVNDSENEIQIETSCEELARRIGERILAVCGGSIATASENDCEPLQLIWSRQNEKDSKDK